MRKEDIVKAVRELKSKYNTSDPFAICRGMGVQIVYAPLTDRVRAFYQQICGVDIIYLSDSLTPQEETVLLSHELGHCVLHRGLNAFFITRSTLYPVAAFEREADEFARCLLSGYDIDLIGVCAPVREILLPKG